MLLISLETILLAKIEFKYVTNKGFRKILATQQNLFYEDLRKTQTWCKLKLSSDKMRSGRELIFCGKHRKDINVLTYCETHETEITM